MGQIDKKNYCRFSFRNNSRLEKSIQEQHAGLLHSGTAAIPKPQMFLNKGQDDEMEIACYRINPIKTAFTYFFIAMSCGLLRLLYHWIPHWYVFSTCSACDVNDADKILITEIFKGKHKIYHVKAMKVLTPEGVQKLKETDNQLNSHHESSQNENFTTLAVHFGNGEFRELDKLLSFNFKKIAYIWNSDRQEFVKLHGLDRDVSSTILHASKGLTGNEQFIRRLVYGPNKISIRELPIVHLLFLEVLNPFYMFQAASFLLWFLDNYYYYAATIMIMSIFGIGMTVRQIRKNQHNLKSTVHSSDVCTVLRKSPKSSGDANFKSETISTELLVPGDVLEIPSHGCIMHCDALLLAGNCILNESMLTGESVPVTKTAFPNLPDVIYDPKEHARHTLFCGTKVIQTRYFGSEKVLAVVVRTGFSTAKGSLVRSILYPPPVDFQFEKDSYRFIILLACVACLGFLYTIVTKIMRGIPARDLVVEAFDLITIVVPPALPAAMTVGRFYAQIRLQKKQIFCISPRTINVSGSINCVCFDKTGTLTEDGLDLSCVVPIDEEKFQSPIKLVESLPYNVFVCGLVSCHSLTIIDKQIVGDPLDLKMFESTKWTMEEHDVADSNKFNMIFPTVLKPPKNRHVGNNAPTIDDLQIGIIREFPFSSGAQRMGVIIRRLGAPNFEYYTKGSPEMILNFVDPASVPGNFHDVLENFTQKGYRVIALAHKELKLSYAKVQKVHMENLEKDLKLLGLIVLENRLKIDTTPCIRTLNGANIRVIMATGDNILTALSVAKECEIVRSGQSVIMINSDDDNQLYFTLTSGKSKIDAINNDLSVLSNSASVISLDTIESQIQSVTAETVSTPIVKPSSVYNDYCFAMTGKVWDVVRLHHPDLMGRLVTRGNVFARMSPEHKQQLVQELQNLGYCVAMCGDGANDCGALKAAHTGISLSEAESSVASPFTSKNPNIGCVLDVIKEGRAALVTSFGIFKYMASYSLCQFVSVLILYSIDSNLTDLEFLYIDLFIISIFAFFFGRNEAYPGKLVKETPPSNLMSFSPILSLILHMSLVVAFQILALEHLRAQSWFEPFQPDLSDGKDDVSCLENYVIFTISSFQYIILAVVFSKGKPYRKSIFTNFGFILSAILMTAFSIYMTIAPHDFLRKHFELVIPSNFQFRLLLIVYALVNFFASLIIERFIIDGLVFKWLRDAGKLKNRHLVIEREMNLDSKWPILTSDYKSAASPSDPVSVRPAEIIIETERFERGHVLGKLYEGFGFGEAAVQCQEVDGFCSFTTSPSHSSSETYKSFPGSDFVEDLPYDLSPKHGSLDVVSRSNEKLSKRKSSEQGLELNNLEIG